MDTNSKHLEHLSGECHGHTRGLQDNLRGSQAIFLLGCARRSLPSLSSPQGGGLTVEQLLLLVALGVLLPGAAAWRTVKAGRLPASL